MYLYFICTIESVELKYSMYSVVLVFRRNVDKVCTVFSLSWLSLYIKLEELLGVERIGQ